MVGTDPGRGPGRLHAGVSTIGSTKSFNRIAFSPEIPPSYWPPARNQQLLELLDDLHNGRSQITDTAPPELPSWVTSPLPSPPTLSPFPDPSKPTLPPPPQELQPDVKPSDFPGRGERAPDGGLLGRLLALQMPQKQDQSTSEPDELQPSDGVPVRRLVAWFDR
jgi:hypothetical protein